MIRDRHSVTLLAALTAASVLVAGDLRSQPPTLAQTAPEPFAATSREPVSYGWLISPERPLEHEPSEPRADSKHYWLEASATELATGVDLHTTAPGAIVRLQPISGSVRSWAEELATAPEALVLTTPGGATLNDGTGFELALSPEQLRASEVPFDGRTTVFRLAPELGAGTFRLAAPDLAGGGAYRIHLFDRGSGLALALYAERAHYLDGEHLWARARFEGVTGAGIERLRVRVAAPNGRRYRVASEERGGEFFLRWPVDASGAAPGLWELEAEALGAAGDQTVVRFGRLPFSVAYPTARLAGRPARVPATSPERLRVRVPIEVSVAGRYEVRAVLRGGAGGLAPQSVSQSAAWLEPGAAELVLDFPLPLGAGDWTVLQLTGLELRDQSRLGVLGRQRWPVVLRR